MSLSTKANIEVYVDVDIWEVYDALSSKAKDEVAKELLGDIIEDSSNLYKLLNMVDDESIKSYIRRHFRPCDMFDVGDLEAWALYYGYEKVK